MFAGIGVGYLCHENLTPDEAKAAAGWFALITDIFLRLIKMIIAPLVFATLVSGIAHLESAAQVGRIGVKTVFWFILASLTSLTIGLVLVQWLEPGVGLNLPLPPVDAQAGVETAKFTLKEFITHVFPKSIVEAMANNEILQIVVFSLFVGTAIASLAGKAPGVVALVDEIAAIMLKVTSFVMGFAPFAVFAALANTIATQGIDVIYKYATFVGEFYAGLGILWGVLFVAAFLFIGFRAISLYFAIREPVLIAFSTASSEAAYPKTLEVLQRFGVSREVASFVLPLGYSFNLDGSMMYCTFATLFIAQAYNIHLSQSQQITMLLLLMVTSKGMAGVPRASLVVIAATLASSFTGL